MKSLIFLAILFLFSCKEESKEIVQLLVAQFKDSLGAKASGCPPKYILKECPKEYMDGSYTIEALTKKFGDQGYGDQGYGDSHIMTFGGGRYSCEVDRQFVSNKWCYRCSVSCNYCEMIHGTNDARCR